MITTTFLLEDWLRKRRAKLAKRDAGKPQHRIGMLYNLNGGKPLRYTMATRMFNGYRPSWQLLEVECRPRA